MCMPRAWLLLGDGQLKSATINLLVQTLGRAADSNSKTKHSMASRLLEVGEVQLWWATMNLFVQKLAGTADSNPENKHSMTCNIHKQLLLFCKYFDIHANCCAACCRNGLTTHDHSNNITFRRRLGGPPGRPRYPKQHFDPDEQIRIYLPRSYEGIKTRSRVFMH